MKRLATNRLVAHKDKPDCFNFAVDETSLAKLVGVPGVGWKNAPRFDQAIIHRSHLPLIDHLPEAQTITQSINEAREDWNARNMRTAERGIKLRTTQHTAIDFITTRRGTLLADDPRVGKTGSAIWAHDPGSGSLVIIAPLSTRAVWLGWLRKSFPEVPIGVITGKKFDPEILANPIVWGHYDIIHKWQAVFTIGTLVFDEAHQLTNRESRRSIAAAVLASRAKRVVAMTGTPIWNMPINLWAILSLVAPGAWGSFYMFGDRYGGPTPSAYGTRYLGVSNEAELKLRLSETMLRRRWVDVQADLPPISRSIVVADVSPETQRRLDVLAASLRHERSNTASNLAAYRRLVTEAKLNVACLEAEKILSRGDPVVIWTWHRDFADRIGAKLGSVCTPPPIVIHGDVSPDKREAGIDLWRTSPVARALVCTMSVAQVGIDLSHARFAIFAELDYTPAMLGQAEMRTFAPDRPMFVTFIVAGHLIDQRIVRALIAKLSASDPIGVAAAIDSITALREAILGPEDHGDLDRLLEDLINSGDVGA